MCRWDITDKNIMKKRLHFICAIAVVATMMFSCSKSIIPTAKSTMNSISLEELNLTRSDYELIGNIEASATIEATVFGKSYTLKDPEGDFSIKIKKDGKIFGGVAVTEIKSSSGVLRLGYLANDYSDYQRNDPEDIARKIAKYRLIALAKEKGADGVIEPVVSMNLEQTGWNKYTYYCTVSAKAIKLLERPSVSESTQKSKSKK